MTDTHQCHKCELIFATRSELEYHLAVDHEPMPATPATGTDQETDREKRDER